MDEFQSKCAAPYPDKPEPKRVLSRKFFHKKQGVHWLGHNLLIIAVIGFIFLSRCTSPHQKNNRTETEQPLIQNERPTETTLEEYVSQKTITPLPTRTPSPQLLVSPSTNPEKPEPKKALSSKSLHRKQRSHWLDINSFTQSTNTPTIQPSEISITLRPVADIVLRDPRLLIPDSEIIFSPSATGFDVVDYIDQAGGFLSTYEQYLMITGWTSGAEIVARVALENSINPRILIALLEYQSQCIFGNRREGIPFEYALEATHYYRSDLYGQLIWAVHELSEGYYGRRGKTLTEFSSLSGRMIRPEAHLNAGTVAILYYFAQIYDDELWKMAIDPIYGFVSFYEQMFGDSWTRAKKVEPLLPPDLAQPQLILPFREGEIWAFTGGPHHAFENNGPWAGLDFAPATEISGCYSSDDWVVAMGDGKIVRSESGVVVQDLDEEDTGLNDGDEQTGWVILYLHIDERDRVPMGTNLQTGDKIGHPSCEGGRATGTHVHVARKYNGEWIPAGGEFAFILNGWMAHFGDEPYQGVLMRDNEVITAHQFGSYDSHIVRDK